MLKEQEDFGRVTVGGLLGERRVASIWKEYTRDLFRWCISNKISNELHALGNSSLARLTGYAILLFIS